MHPLVGLVAFGTAIALLLRERTCDAKKLQSTFLKFHGDIKLLNIDENVLLREKRDLLVEDLKKYLPQDCPAWSYFNQGSYAIGTGIKPPNRDFDIDVGIVFDCFQDSYPRPVHLKQIVAEALSKGTRKVSIRRSCVSIQYAKDGRPDFHVDIAIYVNSDVATTLRLARGKTWSAEKNVEWSEQDPKLLIEKIKKRYSGLEGEQFRRCIRYLKAWRNEQFKTGGAPVSIGLTCAAYHWFSPAAAILDAAEQKDADALLNLVEKMLEHFTPRLQIPLPVVPNVDLLGDMTDLQMNAFKEKLLALCDALIKAMAMPESRLSDAREILAKQFGGEFAAL
jgi:hypothetical protein